MKARPLPVAWATEVLVLDRVVMHVVEVALEIVFRLESMFPEAALPDAASPLTLAASADRLLRAPEGEPLLGELFLDPCPACRVLGIPQRQ